MSPSPSSFRKWKIVFLDLEETVLDDFTLGYAACAKNHEKVKQFLKSEQAAEVRLFSFALHNEWDVQQYRHLFHNWLQGALETQLKVDDVFTTEKLFELCLSQHLLFDSVADCQRFHGKQFGFERYATFSPEFEGMELVLLDDDVTSGVLELPEKDLTLRFVNVADLPD